MEPNICRVFAIIEGIIELNTPGWGMETYTRNEISRLLEEAKGMAKKMELGLIKRRTFMIEKGLEEEYRARN